ncbi:MAG: AAA family ATPase [Treponema sp.]|jgi:MoxR-like ATPase|nr:AAA family ATPase [Treponema sp.]
MDEDKNTFNRETGLSPLIAQARDLLREARTELAKRIIGQDEMIDGLLTVLIAGGHILLEGVPGLAKTRAVKALAEITGLHFKRIQFTPDLLPGDLTGTLVWDQATGTFSVRRGPVFANVILADEINRSPAKVQSALLEAMEERQVTIGEKSYQLPNPFFVLATQNPIEHEGTYALPEAELDRFFLKLLVKYPAAEEELRILDLAAPFSSGMTTVEEPLRQVLDISSLNMLRSAADTVFIDPRIMQYIVSVSSATRPPKQQGKTQAGATAFGARDNAAKDGIYRYIAFGVSPRSSLALCRYSKVRALFDGRSYVMPEDIKAAAFPVMRHRLVLSYEAEADGMDADSIISRILSLLPMP